MNNSWDAWMNTMINCTWNRNGALNSRVFGRRGRFSWEECGSGRGRRAPLSAIATYHLEYGQVFLPPQVLLHMRSDSGQHVIRVHDYVHERIQETEERAVATWKIENAIQSDGRLVGPGAPRTLTRRELDSEPYAHRHDSVMDNVQRGHLIVFLTHYEKELKSKNKLGCYRSWAFYNVRNVLTVSKNSVNLEK